MKYIVIILLVLLTSCANLTAIQTSIRNISNNNISYEVKSADLSYTEITVVEHSIGRMIAFIEKWGNVAIINDYSEFRAEYVVIQESYVQLYRVINNNWDEYPKELQEKFLKLEKDAKAIDSKIEKLVLMDKLYKASIEAVILAKVAIGLMK